MRPSTTTVYRPPLFDGRDVTQLVARGGLGLALIAVGWYQVSDRLLLDDQAPWLAVAIAGLVVGCVSGAMWILQLRRAVSLRTAEVRRVAGLVLAFESQGPIHTDDVADDLVASAVAGARFFHRPDCVLVAGHDIVSATEDEHRQKGRTECETCLVPDTPSMSRSGDATAVIPANLDPATEQSVPVDG